MTEPSPTFPPTSTPAGRIIDAQIDLGERFTDQAFCQSFLGFAAWTIVGPETPDAEVTATVHDAMYGRTGEILVERCRTAAREATAYRISPDMVALALHTADTLDESDVVDLDMAPAEYGFARLEVPLPSVRENGAITPVNWMLWYPYDAPGQPRSVVAWLFHDLNEHDLPFLRGDDELGEEGFKAWHRTVGRWHPEWRTGLQHGKSVGPARSSYAARDMESDPHVIARGVAAVIIGEATAYADLNPARFLYGLWMLMAQPVTAVEAEPGDRPSRRRAARSDLVGPTKDGAVRLIALKREKATRKPSDPMEAPGVDDDVWDDTEAGRRSKVRWITRQHWRWQPYGPRKGVEHEHDFSDARAIGGIMTARCRREADPDVIEAGRDDGTGRCSATLKRILIDSYVKGPEGAPLKMTKKVYDVT